MMDKALGGWLSMVIGLAVAGCPDDARRPNGASCEGDGECSSGLCYAAVCLSPSADSDGDTLLNGLEVQLGTDPFAADTDGDGKDDRAELSDALTHLDADGDGRPDALESADLDGDGDCLADELDPDETHPDAGALASACQQLGVCASAAGSLALTCPFGAPVCNYAAVAGYEADEAACDGADNDCDGQTDEACGLAPLDCAAVLDANGAAADGVYPLDPDGATGPLVAPDTACVMTAERGGWTRWTGAVADAHRDGLREYLLYQGGAWYRSPPTTQAWAWDHYQALPGRWVVHRAAPGSGENGITDLDLVADCQDRGEAGQFGFGCSDGAVGLRVLPGGSSDPANGTGAVCESALNIFGGIASCEAKVEVYVRWVACLRDPGSEVGDGGFAGLGAALTAGTPDACWLTKGTVFAAGSEVPVGGKAPSLQVVDPVAPGDPFHNTVVQPGLMIIAGHAYHLTLALRAESAREIPIALDTFEIAGGRGGAGPANFLAQSAAAGPAWRTVSYDFMARQTSYRTQLELDFGGDATGDVWVDDVVLTDRGAGACDLASGELLGDTTFERGFTCWVTQNDDPAHATIADVTVSPTDHAVRITAAEGAAADAVAYLEQLDIPLHADAWYELTVDAEATPDREVEVAIMKDDFSVEYARFAFPLGAARGVTTRRFIVPAGTSPRAVKLRVGVPLMPAGDVTLYQVRLVEMGPNPCTSTPAANALIADGDFSYRTLCWEVTQSDLGATLVSASNAAPEGQPPTLKVTMAHTATEVLLRQRGLTILANRWYALDLWMRADTSDPIDVSVHEPDGVEVFYTGSMRPVAAWSQASARFITTAGSAGGGALDLALGRPGPGNFVELDLVALTDLGPTPCATAGVGHLVLDPGFRGALTCWQTFVGAGLGVREETFDTSSPPSAIATVIQTPGLPSDLRLFQEDLALESGVTYTATFRAHSLGASRPVTIVVGDTGGGPEYLRQEGAATAAWQTFSFDFTPTVSTASAVVTLELAGDAVDVVVDDVDIVVR